MSVPYTHRRTTQDVTSPGDLKDSLETRGIKRLQESYCLLAPYAAFHLS